MDYIFVVSDGTGNTGEQTLKAALTQFAGAEVKIERRPEVRNEKQILQVVKEAAKVKGFIVQTLVSDEMRELIMNRASTNVLRVAGQKAGMKLLRDNGLAVIYDGITTIDEVVKETISER